MASLPKPCRRPEIAWRVIDGEAVVVHPRAGLVYPFNPVATRCWELADGQHSVADMVEMVAGEFEASREQIQQDVEAFLRTLQEKGLIDGSV